jgi:hypothetical protein
MVQEVLYEPGTNPSSTYVINKIKTNTSTSSNGVLHSQSFLVIITRNEEQQRQSLVARYLGQFLHKSVRLDQEVIKGKGKHTDT